MAKQKEQTDELLANTVDAQEMIDINAAKKTVVKYNDRVKLKIVTDTRHYKEGDLIAPHRVVAEQLLKQGIAEEYKD